MDGAGGWQDRRVALLDSAKRGDCGAIGEVLHAEPSLLHATDEEGRNILHWAVANQHTKLVKYLLGRWRADTSLLTASDSDGNTPLHLYRGPAEILLLLCHSGQPPPLTAPNALGLNPIQAAVAANGGDVRTAEQDAAPFLRAEEIDARSLENRHLFCFLTASPLRVPPSATRSWPLPGWWRRLARDEWLMALLLPIPFCACLPGAFGVLNRFVLLLLVLLGATLALFVLFQGNRRRKNLNTSLGKWLPKDLPALALFESVAILMVINDMICLPHVARRAPVLCAAGLLMQLAMVCAYTATQLADPGAMRCADPRDADAYWQAFESDDASHRKLSIESEAVRLSFDFCPRSELRRVARSKFSPMAGTLVRVLDHDCKWMGLPVGEGNHLSFIAFLIFGELALLLFLPVAFMQIS